MILGAAGRDFHVFNTVFPDDPDAGVVAFTPAPIPGPAVLAALAEYGEALVGADTSQPKSRERVLARGRLVEAGIAMANAIRAERDGAS